MNQPPITFRHKYELTIKIGAHSANDLFHTLQNVGTQFCMDEDKGRTGKVEIVSSSGYVITGDIDPDWTEERYTKELMEWAEKPSGAV